MRAALLCLLLLFFGLVLQGQENGFYGLQFGHTFTGETYHQAAGLGIEGMFGTKFSVNFSVLYGPISSEEYYFYAGGGQALGVYLIKKGFENTSDLALALPLGIMSFVVPESVAYRIPLTQKSQLGIYLSPFGYEVLRNTATKSSIEKTTYELGLRFYFQANRWIYIVPRIGMKGFYEDRALGTTVGLSVLLRGKTKEVE